MFALWLAAPPAEQKLIREMATLAKSPDRPHFRGEGPQDLDYMESLGEEGRMTYATGLRCVNCGAAFPLGPMFEGCPACRESGFVANLTVDYDYAAIAQSLRREDLAQRPAGLWRYPELLPTGETVQRLSMGEGNTPLVWCQRLGQELGLRRLYAKNEATNPTGSFKDRLCCLAVAQAWESGAQVVTAASTGNHGASLAAYAARAGLRSVIFTLADIPPAMLTLMQVYGAAVVAVDSKEGRWMLMEQAVKAYRWYPAGTYVQPPVGNPYGVEAYKTIAYEICAQLGWQSPDLVFVPVGHGDGLSGMWKGFKEFQRLGFTASQPAMVSVEALGALAKALSRGRPRVEPVSARPTVAFSIGSTLASHQALLSLRESGGRAVIVSDEEIMEAQKVLAHLEGLYAEPSSAAAVAGLMKLARKGEMHPDRIVVCLLTSGGLKDPGASRAYLPPVPTAKIENAAAARRWLEAFGRRWQ